MLQQLSFTSAVLLQAVQRQGPGVQGPQQAYQGDAAVVSSRPVPQHRHSEEESRFYRTQEVHRSVAQGER